MITELVVQVNEIGPYGIAWASEGQNIWFSIKVDSTEFLEAFGRLKIRDKAFPHFSPSDFYHSLSALSADAVWLH